MAHLADKLLKGAFLRVLLPIMNIVVTFFMMPFIIGSIGDRWYGLWILAAAFVGYYGFLELGLSKANERFISRALGQGDNEEINKIFNTCFFLFFMAGLLTMILSIIIVLVTPHFVQDAHDIYVFRIISLMIGFTMTLSFPVRAFVGFLYAHIRFDVVNTLEIVKLILRTALILYFLGRGYGIITLAIISLSSEIFIMIVIVTYVLKCYPEINVHMSYFSKNRIRSLLGYSIYSFIVNIADKLQFHLSAFIITAFLGLSFVTHYNIGARIASYYRLIILGAIAMMFPVFSRFEGQNKHDLIREKFILTVKLNTIFSVLIGGSLLIYGKAFIVRWMGIDYIDSYHILFILIIGLIFNTIQCSSQTLLYGLSRHKMYAITVIFEGIANLVLSLILIQKLGIVGVAMGMTIPMFITNVFIIPVYTNRVINIRLSRYIKTVLAGFVLGAFIHLASWIVIKDLITSSYLRIFILGMFTTLIFILLNAFILLNKHERRYFRIPI